MKETFSIEDANIGAGDAKTLKIKDVSESK